MTTHYESGPADDDIAYRTQTIRYTGVETALDESVSFKALLYLVLYAAAPAFLTFMVLFILATLGAAGSVSTTSTDGLVMASGLYSLSMIVPFLVFWTVFLLVKVPEDVGEWKTLIDGKAAAAESSYAAIYQSLARRRIPVGVSARRIRSDMMAEAVNNRLVITERSYVAYVSVFAFGSSLYVGWTMWRERRGYALIGQYFKDLVGRILGRTGIINQMLRTERVRAMREAVHSAVREGVDAAVAGIEVPLVATFGYDIPIETMSSTASVPAIPPGGPSHRAA